MANGARLARSDKFVEKADSCRYKRTMSGAAFSLFLGLLAAFSPISYAQSNSESDSTLAAIRSLYDNGSYISAELQARRVLEDRRVNDTLRVQLEKYLGFTLVAQGKNESAEEHFLNALRIDSNLTLDPVLTSPKILTVFEAAKAQYRMEMAKNESEASSQSRNLVTVSHGPTFRAILFPGWDQLHQGRRTKGYILLGAGAAAAVIAIASDFLRRDARTNYLNASTPSIAESRYNTYNLYYRTEIYSVSAFVLIYVYSELDAFLNLPPNLDANYSPSTRSMNLGLHITF